MQKLYEKVILTRGLIASGKTTWAEHQVAISGGRTVSVCLDNIRAMLGFGHGQATDWNNDFENLALDIQDQAILAGIGAGKNVIVANTNLQKRGPARIKKLFDGEVTFEVQDFTHVPLAECIRRDALRENPIGEAAIRKMNGQLNRFPDLEAFMNAYEYPLIPYVPKPGSSACIVVDIDGTLAEHVARSPYDYSRLHTDRVFPHIRDMVNMYANDGYDVVVMSGRPDTYRAETYKWLVDNGVLFDWLYMRPAADNRNDADVKHMLFDDNLREEFNVHLWIDDRNRVVRRMRKLNINVMQVADGNF